MDDSRFDTLIRILCVSPSRRAALRALGTLALGGGIAASREEAGARLCPECKRKKHGKCKKVKDGTLCSTGYCVSGHCCPPQCDGKSCGDADECGGICITNQGCAAGETCSSQGQCESANQTCSNPFQRYCSATDDCRDCCDNNDCDGGIDCAAAGYCCTTPGRPNACTASTNSDLCQECCGDGDCADNATAAAQGRTSCYLVSKTCQCPGNTSTDPGRYKVCPILGTPNSQCTDTYNDPKNCGDCRVDCQAQAGLNSCSGGVCV